MWPSMMALLQHDSFRLDFVIFQPVRLAENKQLKVLLADLL
jgi:hypothetical protein